MLVLIPHPAEELKLINYQKEIISLLYSEKSIIYSAAPFWIEVPEVLTNTADTNLKALANTIDEVILNDAEVFPDRIDLPVTIKSSGKYFNSKLTLVILHKGQEFSDKAIQLLSQKNQPVKALKVFRLGIVQNEGPHAKSISKSVWCKIK